ncbi:MAG: hypothetical protein J4F31_06595 [Flavobacteriales bacterium]|nr:hypothetical protein [Flavobacteriales bacterium]
MPTLDPAGNWLSVISLPDNGLTAFIAPYRICPTDNDRIYAGRDRIYLSYDGGQSWTPTGRSSFDGNFIADIAVSPQNSDVAVCATGPVNFPHHIYMTNNGAGSWI